MSIEQRRVQIRGLDVSVAVAGSGPPLVLIHGFLVHHGEWIPLIERLADRFRCIAPDLPGFGKSDKRAPGSYPYTREAWAQTIASVMTELGVVRAHVAGHSMGGSVAITLAADHPERVDRLVLIDSASYDFPVSMKGRLPLMPLIGPIVFKRLYGRKLFVDYFENDVWSGHPGLDRARVDDYYDCFDDRDAKEAAYEALRNTIDLSTLSPKIGRVKAPTAIIWGDEDRIFPVGLAHRLVREIPNATLHIVEGSGHAPNEEHPDTTAALVAEHLQGG